MPLCVNCKTMLPPEAFKHDVPNDPRCIFCVRGTNVIYLDHFQTEKYTKGQAETEYKEVLDKLAHKPNIKTIIEIGKQKDEEEGIVDI
jgi:hypothetical protein